MCSSICLLHYLFLLISQLREILAYYLRARAVGKLLNVNDLLNGLGERYNRFKRGDVSSRTESSDWELDALIDFDAEKSLPSSSTSVSPAFCYT